ncbi:TonB-dependent receptor [Olivibacter domesticus]|uniref:Outer membrane receptor proteins, mostly Fe transport n=1 Tax=Olivibacter domesticus TaxID=407022 RepID=A0A1H7M7P6_OLID1|nr:TonB-dependent receptor [Olivibacter domesticus]SEL07119.1 Outer membrane receptor proteins, mostly Fe transport [Olivibacter domesticus]
MQIKKILLYGYLCVCFFSSYAQQSLSGSISGNIKDKNGRSISGASVYLRAGTGTTSNHQGTYEIKNLKEGKQLITVSALGYKKEEKSISIHSNDQVVVDFILEESINQMDEVAVLGRTEQQEVNRQAYNVTALDASKLHNTTLDLSHALDRVSGVRVRENGGVGSSFNFSLNGFTGKQVKFFIDGVPMDNFGSSFQINNIPINLAERVEVYKGVVPVWLGSDALGGAVNIVTASNRQNYIDASYSFGSFNTHRSAVNLAYTARSGLTFRLNAFQNYSDNDYKVTVTEADLYTQQVYQNIKVKRFHDNYHNETVIANVGVVDKKYADQLLLGITLGKNYAEVQTGARMESVFGAWHRKGNIVMPSLKYLKKNLFVDGLDLRITGNINLGEEQNIDTAYRRYNWLQQVKEYAGEGSERERSMYKYKNNNGIATANLSYNINEKHAFNFNNVLSTFNRTGSDQLFPENTKYDQPRKNIKNIMGLGYKYAANEKWNTSVFVKYFSQQNKYSQSYNPSGGWGDVAYLEQKSSFNKLGYGLATSYFLTPSFQLKASYEKSYRLPETDELFGDLINLEGNIDLKPEKSDNINVGFSYQTHIDHIHHFSIDGNLLYRYATDFIRPRLNPNETKQVMGNLADVTNLGVDGEIRYSFKKVFTAGVNMTYQNLRNNTKFEDGYTMESPLYRDRIPNMPYLFGNADASLFFNNVGKKGNVLSFGYNVLYVHAYYLSWPSQGDELTKRDIPRQWNQDVNVMYTMNDGKYNIAFECKNIVDNRLYDNFSLQKPGRGFYLKLRYFLNNY